MVEDPDLADETGSGLAQAAQRPIDWLNAVGKGQATGPPTTVVGWGQSGYFGVTNTLADSAVAAVTATGPEPLTHEVCHEEDCALNASGQCS